MTNKVSIAFRPLLTKEVYLFYLDKLLRFNNCIQVLEQELFCFANIFSKKNHIIYKEFVHMVEPLLSGIVLGMIPITLAGLFVTAYLQYRRGDQLDL